ncbi:FAD-dependent oxidoreductase [Candidatus Microgenomates bacterium]|nr:FAD-dependent oxidoreductase [Candidatus Microgenomates bacterium]
MYTVKLVDKKDVAEKTTAFWWEKPKGYVFKAGQHTSWELIDPPETDAEGNSRTFSFASAPHEENIIIASRMRDTAFKRVLHNLPIGAEIQMGETEGSMTLHEDSSRPAVFIAGGIGITPFRSLVVDAAYKKLPHKIYLFHSNHLPADAPFFAELQNIVNPNYQYIPTMTQAGGSHINRPMLDKYVGDLKKAVFYLAGKPQMVAAIRDLLIFAGVEDLSIKSEEFEGY